MKFIINCEPEDLPAIAALVQRELPNHMRGNRWPRPGWGWAHMVDRRIKVFIRDTKTGLSASAEPLEPTTPKEPRA